MKKKIKDLTIQEIHDICVLHEDCKQCPFYAGYVAHNLCDFNTIASFTDLDKEVEIDEEDS